MTRLEQSGATNGLATRDGRANLLRAFKASGCVQCSKRYPEVDWSELHLDHIDRRDLVHRAARISRLNPDEAIAELLKCQVLCTACHKEKHRGPDDLIEGQITLFAGSGTWVYK